MILKENSGGAVGFELELSRLHATRDAPYADLMRRRNKQTGVPGAATRTSTLHLVVVSCGLSAGREVEDGDSGLLG